MKILLIAYFFPPDPAVGALRPGRIARFLADRGHQVHVISSPLAGEAAVRSSEGITVERVKPWLDVRATYARLKLRLAGRSRTPGSQATASDAQTWTLPEQTPFWKRHLFALVWLPDDRQGWMAAAIHRGRQLARNGFDVLYSSAPPYSVHLAGLMIRRRMKARWIAEFRDPWTDNPWKPRFVRTRWSDAIDRWLERRCLMRADHVVSVTESVASLFRARPGIDPDRIVVVRNGIEIPQNIVPANGTGNGRILYVGNLYHARDPRPFLRSLASLHDSGRLPAGAGVDFVGACSHFQGVAIPEFAAGLGIGELVNVQEPVPHEVCLRMMRDASVLLLLAQDQPLQVPNKLYEYLGAGRRILAIADRAGETARMLEEVGGHQIVDGSDDAALKAAILASYAANGAASAAAVKLRQWSAENQLERLARLVERKPADTTA
ncbi:MAG: glycosyltransferase family 4 protein [Gemmatimonadetes bacterium]|nr:glycosyltransferase family 4 protein [Gemmatimonadota bacterium]